ncbi:MAG: hypothetical protein BWK77_02715 [Verrucomicrobia bacterium A1]|nr:MAG: hypothetical protein BWK77_02715 [Verrucomicrobia bacterium A1]
MKSKAAFFVPWPVAWSGSVDREARGALVAAYETARAREREFVDSPKRQRYFARMRALAAGEWAASGDLADAQIDDAHLRLWRRVARDAQRDGQIPALRLGDCILVTETFSIMAEREGLLGPSSAVELLCDENSDLDWVASELREFLQRWPSVRFRHTPFRDLDSAMNLMRWMAEECPDRDLVALACPPDDILVDRMLESVRAKPGWPIEIADDPAGRIAVLRERRHRAYDEVSAGLARLDMATAFIRDSFMTALKDHIATDPFPVQMALSTLIRIGDAAHGIVSPAYSEPPTLSREMLRVISSGEDFWYMVLFQILARHGGVSGERLVDGVPALLDAMLSHPARLRRLPVKSGLEALRTAMARRILPALRGIPAPIGGPAIVGGAATPAEDVLWRSAFRIATAQLRATATGVGRDEREKGTLALWVEWVEPFSDAVFAFLRRCHDVGARPGVSLDASALAELRCGRIPLELQPDEDEDEEEDQPAVPQTMPVWVEEEAPVAGTEAPAVRTWLYVHEPGNPASSTTEVVVDPDRGGADFGEFMRHEGIPTVVKPLSVLNAIDHYLALPDDIRAVLPHEVIGTMSWPKLKRGRLRILLRKDGDRLLFHIYARRDWAYRGPD